MTGNIFRKCKREVRRDRVCTCVCVFCVCACSVVVDAGPEMSRIDGIR